MKLYVLQFVRRDNDDKLYFRDEGVFSSKFDAEIAGKMKLGDEIAYYEDSHSNLVIRNIGNNQILGRVVYRVFA